jgi:hypothetical protein
LDPKNIKILSLEAIWNFGKGTGLSWADIRLWDTKGHNVYVHRDLKGSNPVKIYLPQNIPSQEAGIAVINALDTVWVMTGVTVSDTIGNPQLTQLHVTQFKNYAVLKKLKKCEVIFL